MRPPITGGSSPGTTTTPQHKGDLWSFTTQGEPHESINVTITRPLENSFYLRNFRLLRNTRSTIVYGPITITASVTTSPTQPSQEWNSTSTENSRKRMTPPRTTTAGHHSAASNIPSWSKPTTSTKNLPPIKSRSSNGDSTQSFSSAEHTS